MAKDVKETAAAAELAAVAEKVATLREELAGLKSSDERVSVASAKLRAAEAALRGAVLVGTYGARPDVSLRRPGRARAAAATAAAR